jgi:ankyrin repeat protein
MAQENFDNFFDLIEEDNTALIKEFINSGYNINTQIEEGFTPLMAAASVGNLEITKILVEAGADVNQIDIYGTSPLMFAANKGFSDVFNYLAPLTNAEIKGISLLTSVYDDDLEIIQALIATGIDVNSYREKGVWHENGRTALLIAIREGHLGIVKILLEAGADPNLIDEDSGITPLISAVRGQYIEIIRLLLQAGAKINDKDSNGKTALDVAKKIKNSEIIRLLKEAEAVED